MKHARFATLLTAFVALALGSFLFLFFSPERWPPTETKPKQGEALDPDSLEHGVAVHSQVALDRVIREPMNTWSNLIFVWAGAFVLSTVPIGIPRQSGIALIAVGIGSFLYHASASRTLRHVDVAAMYWIYACLIFLAVGTVWPRFRRTCTRIRTLLFFVLPALAIVVAVFRNWRIAGMKPFDLSFVTGIAATFAIVGLFYDRWKRAPHHHLAQLLLTLSLFGISIACQIGDRPGSWFCNPSALIQGHALWHIFGGAACGLTCLQLAKSWAEAPIARPARDQRAPTPLPGGDQPEDISKVTSIDGTH